jgi:outer membrane protein assembly factor BamA
MLVFLSVSAVIAIGQDSPATFKLGGVEFKGLQRVSQQQAVELTGLVPGEVIGTDAIDAAGQKLVESGLFGRVSYRVKTEKDVATLIFEVEEVHGALPVVFDNFVWFTEEEIFNAVKAQVPTYNGTLPETGNSPQEVVKALTHLLRAANIPGDVEYTLGGGEGTLYRHIFSVKGAKLPVCSVHFTGARNIKEAELIELSKSLLKSDYSREVIEAFPKEGLLPSYRKLGHLKAAVSLDKAVLDGDESCAKGVSVTYLVDEGDVYVWDGSEWKGNTVLQQATLEKALGMKPGDVASSVRIDEGIANIRAEYGKSGYTTVRIKESPLFDDRARRVRFVMSLSEGPQYKMGKLTITGLGEAEMKKAEGLFKLKPGDIYDASYLNEYGSILAKNGLVKPGTAVNAESKADLARLAVDVQITLK